MQLAQPSHRPHTTTHDLAYKLMLLGTIRHDPDPGLPDQGGYLDIRKAPHFSTL